MADKALKINKANGQPVEAQLFNLRADQIKVVVHPEAIIHSMTIEERRKPEVINGSRRARIAKGSGTTTSDVNNLLKQFKQVQQMMKSLTGGGKRPKLRGLAGMDLSQLQGG